MPFSALLGDAMAAHLLARQDSLDVTERAVDSHIKNLRRKIGAMLPDVEAIGSVYGLGYRFEL